MRNLVIPTMSSPAGWIVPCSRRLVRSKPTTRSRRAFLCLSLLKNKPTPTSGAPESLQFDKWAYKEAEGILVRYHHCPRRKLFQPTGAPNPVDSDWIGQERTAHVQFAGGGGCPTVSPTRGGARMIGSGSFLLRRQTKPNFWFCPQHGGRMRRSVGSDTLPHPGWLSLVTFRKGAQGKNSLCPWGEAYPFRTAQG